jgi:hypothetical protein
MRTEAVKHAGGFKPAIMAGEEPELCERLRAEGGRIQAIATPMATHDAAIDRFPQWWQRQVRAGYGMGQVAFRRDRIGARVFTRQIASAALWGCAWPLATLACFTLAFVYPPIGAVGGALLLVMAAMIIRIGARGLRKGLSTPEAIAHGGLTMIAKSGLSVGLFRWALDRLRGRSVDALTYKTAAPGATPPAEHDAPTPAQSQPAPAESVS